MITPLCKIMTKYGSDKGNGIHNYTIHYHRLFSDFRDKNINVFELGLGTNNINLPSNMGVNGKPGASLRGWKEYFPNSLVFGADIDKTILFEEDRIKTFFCDQKNPEIIHNMWNNEILKNYDFDLIVEDGLHEFEANLIFLKNSLHKLKLNGVYICEDLTLRTINSFNLILDDLSNEFPNCFFEIIKIENSKNTYGDNNLLVVKKNK